MRTRRRRRNPQDEGSRKDIMLPKRLVNNLYDWHGGQSSAVYSLASTGQNHYVSMDMIHDAIDELDRIKRRGKSTHGGSYSYSASEWKNLQDTIDELDEILFDAALRDFER